MRFKRYKRRKIQAWEVEVTILWPSGRPSGEFKSIFTPQRLRLLSNSDFFKNSALPSLLNLLRHSLGIKKIWSTVRASMAQIEAIWIQVVSREIPQISESLWLKKPHKVPQSEPTNSHFTCTASHYSGGFLVFPESLPHFIFKPRPCELFNPTKAHLVTQL